MTVMQSRTVDWLGIERESGNVVLTIVDDLDWSDEKRHLLALQEKLNTYLSFIESGEVFAKLREQAARDVPTNTPVKVSILAKHKPVPIAETFLEHAKSKFVSAGFTLSFKVVVASD